MCEVSIVVPTYISKENISIVKANLINSELLCNHVIKTLLPKQQAWILLHRSIVNHSIMYLVSAHFLSLRKEHGFLRPSLSPCSLPVVVVSESSGTLPCVRTTGRPVKLPLCPLLCMGIGFDNFWKACFRDRGG